MIQGKAWGKSTQILVTPFCEMHHIEIVPWSRCSKHLHKYKHNLFYVISGELIVKVYKDNGIVDETLLQAGEWTSVGPNEYHEFQTRDQSCIAVEVYYPQGIKGDIERMDQGGKVNTPKQPLSTPLTNRGAVIQDLDE